MKFSLLFFTLLFLSNACKSEHDEACLQSYYPNGNIKIKVMPKDKNDRNLVFTYDIEGNLESEYYVKNHKTDSIIKNYKNGHLYKTCELDQNENIKGWVKFYYENEILKEEFYIINGKREGWHLFFDIHGDTSLYNFHVNDLTYYVRQRKQKNGSNFWAEDFSARITYDKDSCLIAQNINGMIDLPLPDSVFDLSNLSVYFYETVNPEIIAHPDSFIYYDLPLTEMTQVIVPSKFNMTSEVPVQKVFLCQVVRENGDSTIRYNFIKKKFTFY